MQGSHRVPVLIVGGGPVGLALAAELGWRGMPATLIEQGDGAIVTPKMNEVNVRTMEFCRRWGIADKVHNCPFPADYPLDVVFVTSLPATNSAACARPPRWRRQPGSRQPDAAASLLADVVRPDPARLRRSRSPSVRLRYRTPAGNFEDTGAGVIAEIVDLDSGERERIEADYLVGCDGATSAIRARLASVSPGRACSAIRYICSSVRRTFSSSAARSRARSFSPSTAAGYGRTSA